MKKMLILFIAFYAIAANAQPQDKGEYHKFILKKVDDERRKTKEKEWWGKGVIMFAENDIPRMGKTSEVEPMLISSVKPQQKFTGRVYLPQSVGEINPKPVTIFYHLVIDGKYAKTKVVSKGDKMPDAEWSSWVIDFPEYFEAEWENIATGSHKCRVECWAGYAEDETTVYVDENDKVLGATKETKGKVKFLASGDFTFVNGESSSQKATDTEDENAYNNEGINDLPKDVPANWKEAWYTKKPVYKKPLKPVACKKVGTKELCPELVIIDEAIKFEQEGSKGWVSFTVKNSGTLKTCETNVVFRAMDFNSGSEGKEFAHIQKMVPALAPGAQIKIKIEVTDFFYRPDLLTYHILLDYDDNVKGNDEKVLYSVD